MVSLNPLQRGNRSEAKALEKLLSLGYTVYIPFGNANKTDFIIEKDSKLLRVQVKTARLITKKNRNCLAFRACSMKGNTRVPYTKEEVDVFIVVYNDDVFYIPVECITTVEQFLCISSKRKQSNIKYTKDFII